MNRPSTLNTEANSGVGTGWVWKRLHLGPSSLHRRPQWITMDHWVLPMERSNLQH